MKSHSFVPLKATFQHPLFKEQSLYNHVLLHNQLSSEF